MALNFSGHHCFIVAVEITSALKSIQQFICYETGDIKSFLCLTKYRDMKTYWGVELYLHAFLTSALDGAEYSASRHGHFTSGEGARIPNV